jgi:hypothetical protein
MRVTLWILCTLTALPSAFAKSGRSATPDATISCQWQHGSPQSESLGSSKFHVTTNVHEEVWVNEKLSLFGINPEHKYDTWTKLAKNSKSHACYGNFKCKNPVGVSSESVPIVCLSTASCGSVDASECYAQMLVLDIDSNNLEQYAAKLPQDNEAEAYK